MSTPVVMPQMGESIAEGTIVRWIKKVGDAVDRDEPLFEISTDKVDAEIPSPAAGVVLDISVKEGETVPVNSVVAVIGEAGAKVAPSAAPAAAPAPAAPVPQADGAPTTEPTAPECVRGTSCRSSLRRPRCGRIQDYFGNEVTFFIVERAHKELTVRSTARSRSTRGRLPAPSGTLPWGTRATTTRCRSKRWRFFDSASTTVNDTVAGYAHPSFPSGRPLLEAVADLIRRIHADFTFDPKATTVTTPLRDVLSLRRGVCQDFARLGSPACVPEDLPRVM